MNVPHFIYSFALCVAGPMMCQIGLKRYRRVALIKNVPTSRVASMALGLVELKGASKPAKDLVSPFTQQRCSYWRCQIQRQLKSDWITIGQVDCQVRFYLTDSTGSVLVNASEAALDIEPNCFHTFKTDEQKALVEGWTAKLRGWRPHLLRKNFRVAEFVIPEICGLYVLGEAAACASPGPGHPSLNVEIRKPAGDLPFVISNKSESLFVQESSLKSFSNMIMGVLLLILGISGVFSASFMNLWSIYAKVGFIGGTMMIGFFLPFFINIHPDKEVLNL